VVVEGAARGLHLAPFVMNPCGVGLEQVISRVTRRRALPGWFLRQDEGDGTSSRAMRASCVRPSGSGS